MQHSLDIYARGGKKSAEALQTIFAEHILGVKGLKPAKKNSRVYKLDVLADRQFNFVRSPDSPIDDVFVSEFSLSHSGDDGSRIYLRANPRIDRYRIYDMLQDQYKCSGGRGIHITGVGLKVYMTPDHGNRAKLHTVKISTPNNCNLKYDGHELLIRKMLEDSGIEPTEVTEE